MKPQWTVVRYHQTEKSRKTVLSIFPPKANIPGGDWWHCNSKDEAVALVGHIQSGTARQPDCGAVELYFPIGE